METVLVLAVEERLFKRMFRYLNETDPALVSQLMRAAGYFDKEGSE